VPNMASVDRLKKRVHNTRVIKHIVIRLKNAGLHDQAATSFRYGPPLDWAWIIETVAPKIETD
jgi:hypothetical protein